MSSGKLVIYKKPFGLANLESKQPIQTNMIFEIASMTKQFTGAAILKLAENGKLSLNDTLQKYITFFPPDRYPITIEHLITHTSGIPYFNVDDKEYYLLFKEHLPEEFTWFLNKPFEI
ncbi:serine hydrolase domain-containing protein [Mariniflexile litorale]|uniref:Serine hydrolase domain-containing protein n=1 Tax=Mariniflexile litorale TaxID=3045158 RepID=A0AAU7ELM9_9FLAO|nr:serine hydrolase domain-containing protein [Mariniflexile sp. KMM 9835]MDQ8212981.1 serine hydrolase domain-containing protein [Mariniflexile sp. KMM 9835]